MLKNCMGFILVFVLILPDIVGGDDCEAESWVYASVLDGTIGYVAPSVLNLSVGKFALGLPHPLHRFGIGTTIFDLFVGFAGEENVVISFPVSIYYLPYARWTAQGFASPAIYGSITTNFWPVNHYYHFLMPRVGISFFCVGVELGSTLSLTHFPGWGFYGGIKLSLGGWFGPKSRKSSGGGEE
ncbi:MAG: hypothetical protein ABIL70_08745 [candidate division WOR-3 bacterium]